MEVEVLGVEGAPDGAVVSIRAGSQRKQAAVSAIGKGNSPFRFLTGPAGVNPFRVDLLRPAGSKRLALNPQEEGNYAVELKGAGEAGESVFVRVAVHEKGKPEHTHPPSSMEEPVKPKQPVAAFDMSVVSQGKADPEFQAAAAAAKQYLEEHKLLSFVRSLLQTVVLQRPGDPYTYIAEQFHAAGKSRAPPAEAAPTPEAKPPGKEEFSLKEGFGAYYAKHFAIASAAGTTLEAVHAAFKPASGSTERSCMREELHGLFAESAQDGRLAQVLAARRPRRPEGDGNVEEEPVTRPASPSNFQPPLLQVVPSKQLDDAATNATSNLDHRQALLRIATMQRRDLEQTLSDLRGLEASLSSDSIGIQEDEPSREELRVAKLRAQNALKAALSPVTEGSPTAARSPPTSPTAADVDGGGTEVEAMKAQAIAALELAADVTPSPSPEELAMARNALENALLANGFASPSSTGGTQRMTIDGGATDQRDADGEAAPSQATADAEAATEGSPASPAGGAAGGLDHGNGGGKGGEDDAKDVEAVKAQAIAALELAADVTPSPSPEELAMARNALENALLANGFASPSSAGGTQRTTIGGGAADQRDADGEDGEGSPAAELQEALTLRVPQEQQQRGELEAAVQHAIEAEADRPETADFCAVASFDAAGEDQSGVPPGGPSGVVTEQESDEEPERGPVTTEVKRQARRALEMALLGGPRPSVSPQQATPTASVQHPPTSPPSMPTPAVDFSLSDAQDDFSVAAASVHGFLRGVYGLVLGKKRREGQEVQRIARMTTCEFHSERAKARAALGWEEVAEPPQESNEPVKPVEKSLVMAAGGGGAGGGMSDAKLKARDALSKLLFQDSQPLVVLEDDVSSVSSDDEGEEDGEAKPEQAEAEPPSPETPGQREAKAEQMDGESPRPETLGQREAEAEGVAAEPPGSETPGQREAETEETACEPPSPGTPGQREAPAQKEPGSGAAALLAVEEVPEAYVQVLTQEGLPPWEDFTALAKEEVKSFIPTDTAEFAAVGAGTGAGAGAEQTILPEVTAEVTASWTGRQEWGSAEEPKASASAAAAADRECCPADGDGCMKEVMASSQEDLDAVTFVRRKMSSSLDQLRSTNRDLKSEVEQLSARLAKLQSRQKR